MFEKHLWRSDILRKDAGRWLASLLCHYSEVFFKHFASKNQQPGFYIIGTLAGNGLKKDHGNDQFSPQMLNASL